MKYFRVMIISLAILLYGCGVQPAQTPQEPVKTGVDVEAWASIPAGEFLMGLHDHVTEVDYDYEMMLTDVTNDQYAEYLNQALADGTVKVAGEAVVGYYPGDTFYAHEHEVEIASGDYPHIPLDDPGLRLDFDGGKFTAQSGYENHPMVMVTWFGAKAFCEHHGWRLPGEVEWEKAARGTDGRPFPWGDSLERNNANYYSSHDIFEKTFGGAGNTTPVGYYNGNSYHDYQTQASASPYGLYDMAGNVWQWTGDVYEGQHYRYMRGGSLQNYGYNLRVWTRNNASPEYYSPAVGFRCAR